jgi:hypothetical protein
MATVSARPQPYVSPHNPLLHRGQFTFTASQVVDLGIGHNNYDVVLTLQGGLAAQNIAPHLSYTKSTTRPGTFTITAGKMTAAGDTTIIAATAACTVSFTAIAGASAE